MNKRLSIIRPALAALLAVVCAGCAARTPDMPESTANAPAPAPSQAQAQTQTLPQPETRGADDETADYTALYAPALDEICDVLYNGFREDAAYSYANNGILEMSGWMGTDALLAAVGYRIEDLSGDGVPELLVGMVPGDSPQPWEKDVVLGGFTYKDGEIVTFLDGWARNSYQWLGGGRFYNMGSNGAASSVFGEFVLSPDGTSLSCEDFYFTDLKSTDEADIVYYHNTTGVWDTDASEELAVSDDDFLTIMQSYEARTQRLELTPFSACEYAGSALRQTDCKVRASYWEDAGVDLAACEDASAYLAGFYPAGTEFETTVVFRAEEAVSDFKLLALALRDVDADGNAVYDIDEIFCLSTLRPDAPLAVPMSFPGDIPSGGFSYTDTDGTLRRFTVSVSGMDGSLVVAPF